MQLAWTPNSEANLAGYKVYYGTVSRDYTTIIDVGNPEAVDNQIIVTLSGFSPGITYYYAATAYDVDGFESDYSDEAVWTCPLDPVPTANEITLTIAEDTVANGQLDGTSQCGLSLSFEIVNNAAHGTVSLLNAATSEFTYTPVLNFNGTDIFTYKVSDDNGESEIATVTINVTAVDDIAVAVNDAISTSFNQEESTFVIEMGTVIVNKDWQTVEFSESFIDPIVVAKPASHQDENPCVVRIQNITNTGFEIRLQNWDYLADDHGDETISFVAVERGSFEMSDGTLVEAGSFETDKTDKFIQISLAEPCNVVPVIAASIITNNGWDAVVGRIQNISTTGFEYKLQEQEDNEYFHVMESINYIAWEPSTGRNGHLVYEIGATADEMTHEWQTISFNADFNETPIMIADMQTTDGDDTANLRYNEMNASQMQIKITAEQSSNSDTNHTTEIIGFMAFAVVDFDGDPDQDGLTTGAELETYGTLPEMIDTDLDGLHDGAEVDFWGADWNGDFDQDGVINLLDADSDNDGYTDGFEAAMSFDPADDSSHPAGPGLEVGMIKVDTDWQRISFNNTFVNPVVVAKIVSRNNDDPCVIRLNNIDADGFEIQLQEWDYQDGVHGIESVSYMVMERGSYILDDGTLVEAGHFSSNEMLSFENINFTQEFNLTPVVTASIASFNGTTTVTGRMHDISTSGLSFMLQAQEANYKSHVAETVSYIAWEPSSGIVNGHQYEVSIITDSVDHDEIDVDLTGNFDEIPVVLADMQTTDDEDPSTVRCDNSQVDRFTVRIEEERSQNSEIYHATEIVGYMAIAVVDLDDDPDPDRLSTGVEQETEEIQSEEDSKNAVSTAAIVFLVI
ncbi:MAG: cadherin-like domain-containing protein [Desulfobulbaceae bacterium]|nr:cadherin-like domain-containing protein [Desulfobulbaceae bacterium]